MKKLLFLLLLPISAGAQKCNLSILGGAGGVSVLNYQSIKSSYKNSLTACASIQASIQVKKFSLGIKADVYKIKARKLLAYYDANGAARYFTLNINAFNPGVNFSIFGNRDMQFGRSIIYTGFNLGYMFGSSNNSSTDTSVPVWSIDGTGSASGLTFGLQAGYKYKITNHVMIIAELSPRYIDCLTTFGKSAGKSFNALAIPVTAGVSYSF